MSADARGTDQVTYHVFGTFQRVEEQKFSIEVVTSPEPSSEEDPEDDWIVGLGDAVRRATPPGWRASEWDYRVGRPT